MTRFTSHQSMKSFEGQQATPEPWHLGMLTSARAGASAWVEQRMGRRTAQKRDWRGHQQQTEKRQQNLHIYSEVLSRSGSSLEEGVKISSVPCTARLPAPVCSSFSHTETMPVLRRLQLPKLRFRRTEAWGPLRFLTLTPDLLVPYQPEGEDSNSQTKYQRKTENPRLISTTTGIYILIAWWPSGKPLWRVSLVKENTIKII